MNLEFDPAEHIYRIDGKIAPSVTQLLKAEGFIDDAWFNEYSRERGEYVHKAVHLYETNDLDESDLDSTIGGYLDGWKAFKKDSGIQVLHSERKMADPVHLFAGTADIIGKFTGIYAIIDIKTGAVAPWVGLQLAGYQILDGTIGAKRYALHLMDDGSYRLIPFCDRTDRQIFMAALAVYHWKKGK